MALGMNAFLLQLNYVSEQRKQLHYGLPGLKPKYLSAAPRHPSAVPVGRCSWEGDRDLRPQQTDYCLISYRKVTKRNYKEQFITNNKNLKKANKIN
jgi:hypothetical protein